MASTLTLGELKLRVFQSLDVSPREQRLYYDGLLLEPDEAGLNQLRVLPNSRLQLVVAPADGAASDDFVSFLPASDKGKRPDTERGFAGTGLTGLGVESGWSCPHCTYRNLDNYRPTCEMCTKPRGEGVSASSPPLSVQ